MPYQNTTGLKAIWGYTKAMNKKINAPTNTKNKKSLREKKLTTSTFDVQIGKVIMVDSRNSEDKKTKSSEDDLIGMMKVRYFLGKIFETIQYLEYNLALTMNHTLILREMKKHKRPIDSKTLKSIVASVDKKLKDDRVDLQTFGNLISTLSDENILEKKDLDELEDLLKTRNFLTHQYFKKNKFEEQQDNLEFLNGQANYLVHILNRVNNYNDKICAQLNYLANQIDKAK